MTDSLTHSPVPEGPSLLKIINRGKRVDGVGNALLNNYTQRDGRMSEGVPGCPDV